LQFIGMGEKLANANGGCKNSQLEPNGVILKIH
jgi:hypothetical protein